jgi:ubiquinone/menaquinone biosynthesis C-methylase UbiE
MNTDNSSIETHYTTSNLFETILQALERSGVDRNHVTRADLAAVDEFHVRGQEVSRELANAAALQLKKVLDIGCGLGGACRLLAGEFGCDVTGIDITQEYIRTAIQLSELTGLQHSTRFVHGSATHLPFDDNSFDVVWTQHVQMNIEDKPALYAEVKRVMAANGNFVYYDVLSNGHAPIHFPVPWASNASLSFLITSQELQQLLHDAGFKPIAIKDETDNGIAFFKKLFNRIEQKGWPLAGLHLLMGDNAADKLKNLYTNLVEGTIKLESGIFMLSH